MFRRQQRPILRRWLSSTVSARGSKSDGAVAVPDDIETYLFRRKGATIEITWGGYPGAYIQGLRPTGYQKRAQQCRFRFPNVAFLPLSSCFPLVVSKVSTPYRAQWSTYGFGEHCSLNSRWRWANWSVNFKTDRTRVSQRAQPTDAHQRCTINSYLTRAAFTSELLHSSYGWPHESGIPGT